MKVVAIDQAALMPAMKFPETFDTPPIRRRWPTAISHAGTPAAAIRISISRFQPYVMSLMASGHDLLRRQAAALTRATRARAENEDGLPRGDRRDQVGDEFGRIAAVAIEKDENVGVLSYGGNARLDGAPVTASRLDNDTGTGRGCLANRAVPRAAVHDNDLAHVLRQHGAHDRCNGRFLVEAWNDRRHDGLAVDVRPRRIALARNVAHRLQRSPQLAQAAGGSSDSRALRKSRYVGPFQISRKVCCVALPKV